MLEAGLIAAQWGFVARLRKSDVIAAAEYWLANGALDISAPPGVIEAADSGPISMVLSEADLTTVGAAVGVSYLGSSDAPTPVELLVRRGVLVDAVHGPALAPAHLWTVGLAAWAARSIYVSWSGGRAGPQGVRSVVYGLLGDLAVESAMLEDGARLSRMERPDVAARITALLGAPGVEVAQEVTLHCSFPVATGKLVQEGPLSDRESRSEQVTITIDPVQPDRVRWAAIAEPYGRAEPRGVDEISRAEAARRIAAVVARGADVDAVAARQSLALARRARRAGWNPLTRSTLGNALAGIAFEWWWIGAGEGRADVHAEREAQEQVARYWQVRPRFGA